MIWGYPPFSETSRWSAKTWGIARKNWASTTDVKKENRDISEDLNPTWGFEESMGCDQCDQHEFSQEWSFDWAVRGKRRPGKAGTKGTEWLEMCPDTMARFDQGRDELGVWNCVYHPFRQFDEEKDDRGYPIFGHPNLMKGQNQKDSRNISAPDRVFWWLDPSTWTRKHPKHWRKRHLQMVPSLVFGASPMIGAPKSRPGVASGDCVLQLTVWNPPWSLRCRAELCRLVHRCCTPPKRQSLSI
jgi:hypothetical protein